jgi:hypothetical protein
VLAETLDVAPRRGAAGTSNLRRTIADHVESFVRDSTCRAGRLARQADHAERVATLSVPKA